MKYSKLAHTLLGALKPDTFRSHIDSIRYQPGKPFHAPRRRSATTFKLQPIQQVYCLVLLGLVLQYAFSALTFLDLLPEIAGKSLNGITKNSTYMIPGLLAIAGTWFFEGKDGLGRIAKPYSRIPLIPGWWIFAATCMMPILLLSLWLDQVLLQEELAVPTFRFPSWEDINIYTPMFAKVAISDELFWIGFVYPRLLQAGYSPVKASLSIGVFWGLDYLPFLFTQFFVAPGLSASSIVLGWFALTPLYVWIYHRTRSAVLLVFFNVCMQYSYSILPILPILPSSSQDNSTVAMANLVSLVFGLVLWWALPGDSPNDASDVKRWGRK